MIKVLGIGGSPRAGGNSDILLKKCIDGAVAAGAGAEILYIRDLKISPCRECGACAKTGYCAIKDDMQLLYSAFDGMDRLIIASPIFFYALPSGLKAAIDRCQCLWAGKYLLKKTAVKDKKGIFLSVGGTKGEKLFDCANLTIKYFFDALSVSCSGNLFIRNVDRKGEILEHMDKLEEAFALGKTLAL